MHTWPLASSHWAVSASFSQQGLCKQPPTRFCISCHLSAGDLNSCCQICVPRSLPISPVHTGLEGKQDLSHREQLHGPTQGRAGSLLTGAWASEIPGFQQDYTPASGFFFESLGRQDMHMCQATGRKLFPSAQQTGGGRQKGTVVVQYNPWRERRLRVCGQTGQEPRERHEAPVVDHRQAAWPGRRGTQPAQEHSLVPITATFPQSKGTGTSQSLRSRLHIALVTLEEGGSWR